MTGDHSENLSDFRLIVGDVIERQGRQMYLVKVTIDRGGYITTVGMLDLLPDEWARLRAAIQAHSGGISAPHP